MTRKESPGHGRSTRAVALTALLVASAVAAGVGATAVGTASAQPTGIDGCTTIDESGVYELTANVTNASAAGCIEIAADDVVLDGNGWTVESEGDGVLTDTDDGVENLTVRNLTVVGAIAVDLQNVTDAVVANVTLGGSFTGIRLDVARGENVTFRDSVVRGALGGIYVSADDSAVVDNRIGGTQSGSEVTGNDTVVRNNTVAGATGLHGGNANTLSIEGRNVVVADNVVTGGQVDRLVVGGTNVTVRDNRVRGTEIDSDYYASLSGLVVYGTNNTVVGNNASRNRDAGIDLSGTDHTVRDNVATSNGVGIRVTSQGSLIYDNVFGGTDGVVVAAEGIEAEPNTWNVTPRSGENVIGGDTVAGNYYANAVSTGFSRTCEDAADDGLCDSANEMAAGNTDYAPLADPRDAPASVVDGRLPTDPDGDGRYEDVDGDGTFTYDDVVTFFVHLYDPTVQGFESEYDFDGNGGVTYSDVVALFLKV